MIECKDCRYYKDNHCSFHNAMVSEKFYCGSAERKKDEEKRQEESDRDFVDYC